MRRLSRMMTLMSTKSQKSARTSILCTLGAAFGIMAVCIRKLSPTSPRLTRTRLSIVANTLPVLHPAALYGSVGDASPYDWWMDG